jgi:superfamily II DNA or RNA helicase
MNKDQIQEHALSVLLSLFSCPGRLRVGLDISMGVGKTLLALKFLDKTGPSSKVLIVGPKKTVKKTWIDECDNHGFSHLKINQSFVVYRSLVKVPDINAFNFIILDECHNLLDSHRPILTRFNGHIIGLTGTPPKYKHTARGQMVNDFCPITYNYKTDDAVDDGILNDYVVYVHLLELDKQKNLYKTNKRGGGYYTSEQAVYDFWTNAIDDASGNQQKMTRLMRMKSLMSFPSKEKYAKELFNFIDDKVLLFANTKEQASKLCEHTYFSGNPDSEVNLEKFKAGFVSKLAAVLQLNEGVNIPDLKQGIIMHAYGNERTTSQRLGRLLRLKPDETGKIHILCYKNTIDQKWVESALSEFDKSKIKWVERKKVIS